MGVNGSRHAPATLPPSRDMEPTTEGAPWASVLLQLCINSKFGLLETINVTNGDLWNEKSRSNRTHFSQDLYVFPDRRRDY
jgi:hypothetical protein